MQVLICLDFLLSNLHRFKFSEMNRRFFVKNFTLINVLCASLAVSACSDTKVQYFVEPIEGVRMNLKSDETQASGSGLGFIIGLVAVGYLVSAAYKASCRPGQYRPVVGGYGGLYWDGGNC